jgi:Tc toxin complex TcA C-terminal TcB-binding domain
VSLRQLDPVALVALKSTGSCQVGIPEWLYDLDGPGHYMRRIKSVAISIPAVAGPYSSVSCTLTLLGSSLRKSPIAGDDYLRQGREDERFIDFIGAVQSVVTSSGQMDSGLFETNLRDERFLPFEGAGAVSTWKLDLPKDYRSFDYGTISDAVLHVRYTARQGVEPAKVKKGLDDLFSQEDQSHLALVFHLGHEFPTEWAAFVSKRTNTFQATIRKDDFPYFTQPKSITIVGWDLYAEDAPKHHIAGNQSLWDAATVDLADKSKQSFLIDLPEDGAGPTQVLTRSAMHVYLVVRYSLS